MLNKSIKILFPYNKEFETLEPDLFVPINMETLSISNDNIFNKYRSYELSLLYWAHKNLDVNYIGVFCDEMVFNLGRDVSNDVIYDKYVLDKKLKLNTRTIAKLCNDYDVILSPESDTLRINSPTKISNYDFYSLEYIKEHLDITLEIISKYYPEYFEDAKQYLDSTKSTFLNMFILRRDIFNEYIDFLFDVLDKLEQQIVVPDDFYQKKVFVYLAKVLQNVFMYHIKRSRSNVKIYNVLSVSLYAPYLRPVLLKKNKIKLGSMPFLNNKEVIGSSNINLVFSVDDKYIQHCAVALTSILLNSYKGNTFNVFILDGGISEINKKRFLELKSIRDFSLTYIKIDEDKFKDLPLNRSHISLATYYRLVLPEVLPSSIEKIIYLDADIVVEQDIEKLWKEDIDDKYAIIVEDEGSICQIKRLKIPFENSYFNAGVCLFNIKKIRQIDFQKIWRDYYEKNKDRIVLQDQDILNGVFNGNCKFIDLAWNTNSRLYTSEGILEHSYSYETATRAAHNPAIIHYTDRIKPWSVGCLHPLKKEYLKYLRYTPWRFMIWRYYLSTCIAFLKKIKRQLLWVRFNRHEVFLRILGVKIFHYSKELRKWL